MGKHTGPPLRLISNVGSHNRIQHDELTQHKVEIRNLAVKEIWAGFVSRRRDDSICYTAGLDDRWEPPRVRLQSCGDRHGSDAFEFTEAGGLLKASPPAGRMTQLLLTAWCQPVAPTALREYPRAYPLREVAENLTIT
jgi:hypothetical protein